MSQKTDNMIKLALVFFVTLLSFSIGTYVGKKYSDNQYKLSLLEPKKAMPTPKADEFASDAVNTDKAHGLTDDEMASDGAEQRPAALTDSEVAKIAEEFASEEEATEEKIVATIDPQEKDLKTISDKAVQKEVINTAKTPVHNNSTDKVAVPKAPENRIPASINPKKEIAPMLFTVQVGSYPNQAEAEKMTQDLQAKGFKTTFVPAKINGQTWFRVNVGLFGSVKEAQDYKKEFLLKTKLSSAIVQRVLQ